MRHMALRVFSITAAAAVLAAQGSESSALNIVLHPDKSFLSAPKGAEALLGFQKAANYWNKTLTTNSTLQFDVHFDDLGESVLGGTYSNATETKVTAVYDGLRTHGDSNIDTTAVSSLKPLSAAGGLGYRTPGTDPSTGLLTVFNAGSHYDDDDSHNNIFMNTNTSINKALGINFSYSNSLFKSYNTNFNTNFNVNADADITFSSTFAFDYDPSDGISVGAYDFTGVAIHEMGHALGFVSGTDDYEFYSEEYPGGDPLTAEEAGQISFLTTFDLFRYGANNPTNFGRDLQLDPNRDAFFALDGRQPFNFNENLADASSSFLSTGATLGDGGQASHWQDANAFLLPNGCFVDSRQIGIMDPTASNCQNGIITSNDLAAFDAMGWNINIDANVNRGYTFDTRQVWALPGLAQVAPVPEPSSWAIMIVGSGLIGGSIRRRRSVAAGLAPR